MRWEHPTRGLIAPGDFVPAAEKTGLIESLTRYVLDEALGQVARWESQGRRLNVAVNLSMRNLHDADLPEQVARLLLKWQLPGQPPDRRDHRELDRLGSRQVGDRRRPAAERSGSASPSTTSARATRRSPTSRGSRSRS